MGSFDSHNYNKKKVVFILGATGAGKSRLSIDIATHFCSEIINSDKMQVYKALSIVTNKVTESEQQQVPHHLLGFVEDPDSDYTARDFCIDTLSAIDSITKSGHVPVIVGGSNSYIEELVENTRNFKSGFDCCFIWLRVSPTILHSFVSIRVDQMVSAGLVDEVRSIFVNGADYSKGVRRSIGVPEFDKYFKNEKNIIDRNGDIANDVELQVLLKEAIEETKANTIKLIANQVAKIERLRDERGWVMNCMDATRVLEKRGKELDEAWDEIVKKPCLEIVENFLKNKDEKFKASVPNVISSSISQPFGELQVAI